MKDDILAIEKKHYSRNRYAQESNSKLVVKLYIAVSQPVCVRCAPLEYI